MKILVAISILFSLLSLTACSKTYTVDELVEDTNKRNEILSKCMTGKYKGDEKNCQNALEAESIAAMNALK